MTSNNTFTEAFLSIELRQRRIFPGTRMLDRILDALLLRFTADGRDNLTGAQPSNTTGSILFGALTRMTLIVLVGFICMEYFHLYDYWMVAIFAVVGFVFYPAYRQYALFYGRMEQLEENTLCGQCKHFDVTGQLCKIYDEHVSLTNIPCGGEDWEPISYEDRQKR